MTHGDKDKAKKAASKASGDKKSSKAVTPGKAGQTRAKAESGVQTVKNGKTGKEGGGKAAEARPKGGEKAAAAPKSAAGKAPPAKASDVKSKARPVVAEQPAGFTNPLVSSGFKRALKKFPNAFRRLTD